jgi:type I restriction enzyme, R subunit
LKTNLPDYTELKLFEHPAIDLFAALGWETRDCSHEKVGSAGTLGRETRHDVLLPRLRAALERLNPELPERSIAVITHNSVPHLHRVRSAWRSWWCFW